MIPTHYSLDIATRCRSLLKNLLPVVQAGFKGEERFRGPLTTTFLLAISTPAFIMPVERIFKPMEGNDSLGNERDLNKDLSNEVKRVLGGELTFGDAPFFRGDWAYLPEQALFNVAEQWPPKVLKGLSDMKATDAAKTAPARKVIRAIRNALAHGSITYLDKNGEATEGIAAMYGFATARYERLEKGRSKIIGCDTLRVSEQGFLEFMEAWMDWVEVSGVAGILNEKRFLEAAE